MDAELLKENIRRELPALLQDDVSLRNFILDLVGRELPRRVETGDRFYQMLNELRRDREEQNRKSAEQDRKLDEFIKEDRQSPMIDNRTRAGGAEIGH